jgi:hypothetical protein
MLKIIWYCLIFLVILANRQALAESPEVFFQSLNSKHLKVFSDLESQAIKSKTYQLQKFELSWQPELTVPLLPAECQPRTFRRELEGQQKPEVTIKTFWQRCERHWRQDHYSAFTHSQEILRLGFEPTQHPAVRVIQWTLEGGIKVKGLLFLKGKKSRPLVILRTGIFSHLRSTIAERFLMMQLFDEGPYHVLLLPSTTGNDYIEDNRTFNIGGFDEGLQTYEILRLLSNPEEPLKQFITKIHLVGISLGGHGQWFTNLLDKLNNTNLISKTLLFCPAVNLKVTADQNHSKPLMDFAVKVWYRIRLSPLRTYLNLTESDSIFQFVQKNLQLYHQPSIPWSFSDHPLPRSNDIAVYWLWNDFWSWMPKYDFANTLVIWTRQDPVVPPDLNSLLLESQFGAPSSALLELPRGLHCSLPTTYRWPLISLTMRGFLGAEGLLPTTQTHQPVWEEAFVDDSQLTNISIRNLEVREAQFEVQLSLKYKSRLRPILIKNVLWPINVSDQTWVLSSLNDELRGSLRRELSSRLDWSQNQGNVRVWLNAFGNLK